MLIGKTFIDPLEMPFSRRGSYISLAGANGGSNQYAKAQLWISTSRYGSEAMMGTLMNESMFRQIKVELVKDGLIRNCVIHTTPYELTFESDAGSVSFCIGEFNLLRCTGKDGLSIRFTPRPGMFGSGSITNMHDGTFKSLFGNAFMHFVPLSGLLESKGMYLEIAPDSSGLVELAVEEFTREPKKRASYPSYSDCVAMVKADFDSFAEKQVKDLPASRKEYAMKAAWVVWGLTVVPDGKTAYKRQMVKMMRLIFEGAFSWQQGMHAFFLAQDPDFAWEVLLAAFDVQDENGRIADSLAPTGSGNATMKPPIEGYGLVWQMEHFDISKKPKAELEFLYNGMEKWTNFYLNFRDVDKDGLFENQSAGETGWESGSYQRIGFPLAAPDMNAYLAFLCEALAKLGRIIGKDEFANAAWEQRSKDTIQKLIDAFWTEDGWVTFNAVTKVKSAPTSLIPYCTLILGKRLPQHIIDRSIELVFDSGEYETDFGLASEQLNSPMFTHGWCGGSIATPVQALMVMALDDCGRPDLAKKVAAAYLNTMEKFGLYHIHNTFDGTQEYQTPMFFRESSMFYCGWTAGCYLFLAKHY